jgi:hypothetical protein
MLLFLHNARNFSVCHFATLPQYAITRRNETAAKGA